MMMTVTSRRSLLSICRLASDIRKCCFCLRRLWRAERTTCANDRVNRALIITPYVPLLFQQHWDTVPEDLFSMPREEPRTVPLLTVGRTQRRYTLRLDSSLKVTRYRPFAGFVPQNEGKPRKKSTFYIVSLLQNLPAQRLSNVPFVWCVASCVGINDRCQLR